MTKICMYEFGGSYITIVNRKAVVLQLLRVPNLV